MGALPAAFVVAVLLTPLVRILALRLGVTDKPESRKLHTTPVPYLGGVAVAVAVVVGTIVGSTGFDVELRLVSMGVILGVLGLWDDLRPMLWIPKLALEFGVGIAATAMIVRATDIDAGLPVVLFCVVAVVALTIMTNSFNLLDNMDGHLTSVVMASSLPMVWLARSSEMPASRYALPASLAAACFGFLFFNLSRRAKIFLGDSGSLMLGFLVTSSALLLLAEASTATFIACLALLLFIPCVDTATVAYDRRRNGISIFTPGKDHLSHRLALALGDRLLAVGVLALIQLAASTLAVVLAESPPNNSWPLLLLPVLGAALVIRWALGVDPRQSVAAAA